MLDLIRASALAGYEELCRELGGDPVPALRDAHIAAGGLGSPDAFIPFRSMAALLERASADLDCPDFSLRLAARQEFSVLGPLALVARHSATAEDGLQALADHLGHYTSAVGFGFSSGSEAEATLAFDVLVPGISSHAQVYQLTLGVALQGLRMLIRSDYRPLLVSLPHARPRVADFYESYFGCRVRFEEDRARMLLSRSRLVERRANVDAQVRDHLVRCIEAEMTDGAHVVGQVRHLIRLNLPMGRANAPAIALHLGVHPRTVQRMLAQHDVTFAGLLDEVRRELATTFLVQSRLPLSRVAALLGYSQQSCLSRASIRWFGVPPLSVRNAEFDDGRPSGSILAPHGLVGTRGDSS